MEQTLVYHLIRILIHRPVIGSSLGSKAAATSVVAVATSSKAIIQIVQLLEERRMSFSFCLNKNELLISCGFALLFQGIDLKPKGTLIQDSRRFISLVLRMLERNHSPSAGHFKEVAGAILAIERSPKASGQPALKTESLKPSEACRPAPPTQSVRKPLQAIACRFSSDTGYGVASNEKRNESASNQGSGVANPGLYSRNNGQHSISPALSNATVQRRYSEAVHHLTSSCLMGPGNSLSIDYPSFGTSYPSQVAGDLTARLLVKDEADRNNGYSHIQLSQFPYDGQGSSETYSACITPSSSSGTHDCLSDMWKYYSDLNHHSAHTHSAVSFSEDEGTSGEDLGSSDLRGKIGEIMMPTANGFCVPNGFGL